MATAVIYEGNKISTTTHKALFTTWERKYKNHLFHIQLPDGTEENVIYATKESSAYINVTLDKWLGETKLQYPALDDGEKGKRVKELQKIVNRLEGMGYRTPQDQLALFMSGRIDKLILSSK